MKADAAWCIHFIITIIEKCSIFKTSLHYTATQQLKINWKYIYINTIS